MLVRTAVCACGQLKAICEGDPDRISICACTDCQRRTGSMYGVGAYFCPDCGSTVYWRLELRPHHIGVAVGAFNDPKFPDPQIAVWLKNKRDWITFPEALPLVPTSARVKTSKMLSDIRWGSQADLRDAIRRTSALPH